MNHLSYDSYQIDIITAGEENTSMNCSLLNAVTDGEDLEKEICGDVHRKCCTSGQMYKLRYTYIYSLFPIRAWCIGGYASF